MNHFILSLDFELGWGSLERGQWRIRERAGVYQRLRPVLQRLMSELDILEIPTVWGTVGAMVAEPEQNDFSHLPEAARHLIEQFTADAELPSRYGWDLLEAVLSARVDHEIASHSYSHTRFDFEGFDRFAREEDLRRSVVVLKQRTGRAPRTFVFPQNIAASFETLERWGFQVARVASLPERRWGTFVGQVVRTPPAVKEWSVGTNLLAHSSSLYFNWNRGRHVSLRRRITLMQARRALHRTARGRGDTHIWLHPYELAECPTLFDDLIAFLHQVAKLRDRGILATRGMMR